MVRIEIVIRSIYIPRKIEQNEEYYEPIYFLIKALEKNKEEKLIENFQKDYWSVFKEI